MVTKYNIEIGVERASPGIDIDEYMYSVFQLREKNFLGKKHVNHFGRVFEDHDKNCGVYKRGVFEMFERNEGRTIKEIVDEAKIKTSGNDETGMRLLEMAEETSEILEKDKVAQVLPYGVYRQMPIIGSMELNLVCGKQSSHVHCENGEIIQFWKPKKDRYWYDSDTLKGFLFDRSMEYYDAKDEMLEARFRKQKWNYFKAWLRVLRLGKYDSLYSQFMKNPDLVTRM